MITRNRVECSRGREDVHFNYKYKVNYYSYSRMQVKKKSNVEQRYRLSKVSDREMVVITGQ